jgi:hypothetical protein
MDHTDLLTLGQLLLDNGIEELHVVRTREGYKATARSTPFTSMVDIALTDITLNSREDL